MGKCSGRSMALLALTFSLFEITPASAANPSKLAAQARRYCRRQGGEVQTRVPTFGTNNPQQLRLNGTRQFCNFTSPTGGTHVPVLEACVFPDQSVIDSFGIFYHAKSIVRGVDLTSSFAYQSDNPPFVFGD
jgi:hypothetical protein